MFRTPVAHPDRGRHLRQSYSYRETQEVHHTAQVAGNLSTLSATNNFSLSNNSFELRIIKETYDISILFADITTF